METIYKDRLIPESRIYNMSEQMHSIRSISANAGLNALRKPTSVLLALGEIKRLNSEFKKTRLTKEEEQKIY